jgi:hypothetical protein
MLSDSLFTAFEYLKEEFQQYEKDYSAETCVEVVSILERINALRYKLDADNFVGSMRFEDEGALDNHKKKVWYYMKDVYELAGDLSEELPDCDDEIRNDIQLNWQIAMKKVEGEGKLEEYLKIRLKYFPNS